MPELSGLRELQTAQGGEFRERNGRAIPTHFGDPLAEHAQTIRAACLFDLSDWGHLEISGKDAPSFLHNLSTNDINNLPLGGGCEAYFCDHRAKVLAHAFVYHVIVEGRHAFWLGVTPGHHANLLSHLDKHLISEAVELMDQTEGYSQFHLAGPLAQKTLEAVIGQSIPDLAEFQHMERVIAGNVVCHIRRHDPLGLPGFDIVCRNERAGRVWQAITSAGADPAGSDTYELLRVEAGTPVYGIDIGSDRFVMEVARALRAVSYSKGCYLGQEPIVMARDRAGFVNRAFLGVKVLEGAKPVVGSKLFRDGAEVGLITSVIDSPSLGAPLAVGYIRRGHQDVGLRLELDEPTGRRPVEVLPYPPVPR